jgi:PAS domain S-box-containing protein
MQVPDPRHGLLQRVIESSPLAMVVTEESGRILLVNSRTEQMFGYDAHDLIGQPVEKLIPTRFRDGHVRMRAAFTAAPSVREMGDRLGIKGLRRDGMEFPVSIHLSTMDAPMGRMTVAWISDQKLAQDRERRLLELNALLESVNRSIPGAIFQRPLKEDGSLEFSYFAGDFAQRWRLTVVEVARNPAALFRFIHPDDLSTIAGALNTQKDNHAARQLEFRMLTADGDLRWINLRTRVDTNPAGEPVRTGVLLDVTDQKRTEAALAESERRFRAIISNLPGAVFQQVFRLDGTVGYNFISEGIEQITGISAADFLRDTPPVSSLFLAEERDQQLQAEAEGRGGEVPFRTRQLRLRRKDGGVRWVQTRSTSHRAQDGTIVWDGITIDVTEERAREEELREAQRRLTAITDNVPAVVFEQVQPPGEEPRMVFVNRRVSDLFGIAPEEFIGRSAPVRHLLHLGDQARVIADASRQLEAGEDWNDEFRIVLPGNVERWIRGSATQKRRADGSIVTDGVYIDVTQEKVREVELQEAQHRLIALTDNVPAVVFERVQPPDGEPRVRFVSRRVSEILGVSQEDFLGKPFPLRGLFHKDDEARVFAEVARSIQTGEDWVDEFRLMLPDKGERWIRGSAKSVRQADGSVVSAGVYLDVTQERAREEALRETQRRLVALTDNVPAVVFERVQTPEGEPKIVFVNRQVRDLFGLSHEDVVGKTFPFRNLIHKEDEARVLAEIARSAETGEDWTDEYRITVPGQGERWIRGTAKPARRADGTDVWYGVYVDVTPEKQAKLVAERLADQTRAELLLAAQLQGYMMWEAQVPPYLKAATYYRPSQEVSGDILYSRALRNGEFLCAIGDATGHGVTAALLTMLTVALLDASEDTWTPAEILRRLNDHLGRRGLDGRSVTCIVIKFRPDGGILAANAGHPPALILSKATEAATTIESSGPPLGWFPDQAYEDFAQTLNPGSTLFVYTDGLSEMSGSSGAQFGLDRILNIAAQVGAQPAATMEQLVETMSIAAVTHAEGEPPDDDISFVAIRFEPAQG